MNDSVSAPEQLQSVFLWILDRPDIPIQTRRDFAAHAQKVGGLDAKSVDFISKYLDGAEKQSLEKIAILESELADFEKFLAEEKDPKTALSSQIYEEAETEIVKMTENFESDVKVWQARNAATAESSQKSSESEAVEALKKSIG